MTREELLKLREDLLMGSPHYTVDPAQNKVRKGGIPGLDERRQMGAYSPDAAFLTMLGGAVLQLTQHLLDRMRKS